MNVYGDKETERWFLEEYHVSGKKVDMGKSRMRFKRPEDLPLELIARVIARTPIDAYVARVHQTQESRREKA